MSLVPATVELSPVAARPGQPWRTRASWLVLACYLLGALALTARLWADPAGSAQAGDPHDVDLFAWYLHYAAAAISHGRLPALITTALNPPAGVSVMWNTSLLLPGIVLAPLTLLAGPQVSLNVLLTLGFAGSAASLFWVLRRWGASVSAAALGGAVYGFSPAMVDSGIGHYHLVLAMLPPLIIDALCCVVSGGRPPQTPPRPPARLPVPVHCQPPAGPRGWARLRRPTPSALHNLSGQGVPPPQPPARPRGWARLRRPTPSARYSIRMGVWLGLLMAAQVFISEEMLVHTAVAALVLVVLIGASHPHAVPGHARLAAFGMAIALAVAVAICGRALWVQLYGPQREHSVLLGQWASNAAYFVDPPGTLLFHTSAGAAAADHFPLGPPEVLAYLGWPLIVVLVAAAVRFWRDPRVRIAAMTFLVLELCSLGGGNQPFWPGRLLPWHWVQGLPTLAQVLPNRFSILADGAAGAVLAFALDRARSAAPRARSWGRRGIPAAVAVLAVLPLVPLPYQAAPVPPVPSGWRAAFADLRLPPEARVLVVPIPNVGHTQPMRWQADTGEPGSMIGGYFLGPDRTGQAMFDPGPARFTGKYLDWLWDRRRHVNGSSAARIRAALAYWQPAAVVAVTAPGSGIARVLTELFGRPAFHVGAVLAWRVCRRPACPPR